MAPIPNLKRIRISSFEPQNLTDTFFAAIADCGEVVCPHLHLPLQSGSDRILRSAGIGAPVQPAPLPMPGPSVGTRPGTWKAIEEGMWLAVNGPPPSTVSGLGKEFPYAIAGKTGTAERYSRYDETWTTIATSSAERHQVLFECFTPAEEPRVAVVVALEAGKSGASDAAPIARKILDAWLKYDDDAPATPAKVAQQ